MKLKPIDIKRCITANVAFQYYRCGNLYYKTIDGDVFPVPIEDLGNASVNTQEKGLTLMRYMCKFNQEFSESFPSE